jgi:gliding motility-associated-like protein
MLRAIPHNGPKFARRATLRPRMNRRSCLFLLSLAWALTSARTALAQCAITLAGDTVICQGGTAVLQAPAGFPNYLWSTGQTAPTISVSSAGNYMCQVSYPSGNLVTNGNFSAGNTGFSSEFTYSTTSVQNEGYYAVGTDASDYHNQYSGTGTGNFLIGNAGWTSYLNGQHDVWCQTVPVCPGQTYTLSYRARTLSNAIPAHIAWTMNGVLLPDATLPDFNDGWQSISVFWTAPSGTTSVNACLTVTSGDGVGDDFGIDDISISGNIVLSDAALVSVTPLPAVDLGNDTALCQGDVLVLNAAVPGGSYLWNNGSTAPTRTITGPGSYQVTVTAAGCSNADQVNIGYNPLPTVNLGNDTTLCQGELLVLNAAVPGGSYLWNNGSTASSRTVTGPGTIQVTVTALGCSSSDQVNVAYTPLPTVDLGNDTTLCQGDVLVLDATVPGGSYLWNNGSTAAIRTATAAGTFQVTVTAAGCSNSDQVDLAFDPVPTVDLGNDTTLCAGQSITLSSPFPGASYLWQNGSTASSLLASAPGTYWLESSFNACSARDSVLVLVNPLPLVNLGNDTALCQGQVLMIDATVPGASYLWSNGATTPTLAVASSGTYGVVTTLAGCSASDHLNATFNPVPTVDLGPDLTICPGASATFDASWPGATYAWNTGNAAPQITVSTTGTYSVQVSANGCSAMDTASLTVFNMQAVDLGPDIALCDGLSERIGLSLPGATFNWSTGSTSDSIDVNAAGTYWVEATLNGCSASDTVIVNVVPLPVADLGPDQAICPGITVPLDASAPGASCLWNNGQTTPLIQAGPGIWSVAVTANGCTARDSLIISALPAPVVDLGPDTAVCDGDQLVLDAAFNGATYLWNDGNTSPQRTVGAGTWHVEVSADGCTTSDSILIATLPTPAPALPADTTLCPGATWVASATFPGAAYLWSDNSAASSISISAPGTYSVTVTLGSCSATAQTTVAYQNMDLLTLGPDTLLCPGQAILLGSSMPGVSVIWQDGFTGNLRTIAQAGTYQAQFALGNCILDDQINVAFTPLPDLDLGPDRDLCQGDTAWLNPATGAASFHWSNGSAQLPLPVWQSATIIGQLAMDACTSSDTAIIQVHPWMEHVDLGPDRRICPEGSFLLDATLAGASYTWNNGSQDPTLLVDRPGTYHVQITGTCMDAADTVVVTEGRCATLVFIPNGFSPDGDGINDRFMATVSDPVDHWELHLFNRWGEPIFTAHAPDQGWDGTVGGKEAPTGVYVWDLRYAADTDEGLENVHRQGTVTLLR